MVSVGDTIQCANYEDALNMTMSLEEQGYKTTFRMKGLKVIVTVVSYQKPVKKYKTKKNIDIDIVAHEAKILGITYGEYMKKLEIEKIRRARAKEISKRKKEEQKRREYGTN